MPTPNGVNYLLQFLVISSNSPIIRNKNQKWTFSLMSLYLYLSIGISVLMLHINIIYGFNYPNAKGCDTSKRRPRALRILRNIPAPGSTLPFSMREIYELLVPTR